MWTLSFLFEHAFRITCLENRYPPLRLVRQPSRCSSSNTYCKFQQDRIDALANSAVRCISRRRQRFAVAIGCLDGLLNSVAVAWYCREWFRADGRFGEPLLHTVCNLEVPICMRYRHCSKCSDPSEERQRLAEEIHDSSLGWAEAVFNSPTPDNSDSESLGH